MTNIKGENKMRALLITLVITVTLLLGTGVTVVGLYVSNSNYANTAENRITSQYDVMRNVRSSYTLKIMDMAQVPSMYKDDLMDVITATFEGRYGNDGSKAVFQFIQEQNMQLDSKLYSNIQAAMEAGRNEFQVSQNRLIDLKRQYETSMGYVVKGMFIRMAGFPKIDLGKYDIIIEATTQELFDTKVDKAIKLR